MKVLVVGDVHWSQYSSILRKRGDKYSIRLENLINSVNWVENLSRNTQCELIVYLGDFLDKSELNSEEITSITDIKWNNQVKHIFLVGNHEMGRNDLSYSSAHLFSLSDFMIINQATSLSYENIELSFLPYILESNRESLDTYFKPTNNRRVIFSHNDIKDFQMGQFISKEGFSIEEIENNCDLYLNGHLHNGNKVTNKIINVGNLTGQNFSEDAFKYDHVACVLDTDTLRCEVYENPNALNFYKIDFTSGISDQLVKVKNNSVMTLRAKESQVGAVKAFVNCDDRILEYRLIIEPDINDGEHISHIESFAVDHLKQFETYILDNLGTNDIIKKELMEVLN